MCKGIIYGDRFSKVKSEALDVLYTLKQKYKDNIFSITRTPDYRVSDVEINVLSIRIVDFLVDRITSQGLKCDYDDLFVITMKSTINKVIRCAAKMFKSYTSIGLTEHNVALVLKPMLASEIKKYLSDNKIPYVALRTSGDEMLAVCHNGFSMVDVRKYFIDKDISIETNGVYIKIK